MQRIRLALSCALLAALTGVAVQVQAILLLHAATGATRALPVAVSVEIQATRAALVAEINATRADLINQVEAARKDLLGKADAQFSTIQSESFRQITEFRSMADRRLRGHSGARGRRAPHCRGVAKRREARGRWRCGTGIGREGFLGRRVLGREGSRRFRHGRRARRG